MKIVWWCPKFDFKVLAEKSKRKEGGGHRRQATEVGVAFCGGVTNGFESMLELGVQISGLLEFARPALQGGRRR